MSQIAKRNQSEQSRRESTRSRFLWTVIVVLIMAAVGLLAAVGYAFWLVYLKTGR